MSAGSHFFSPFFCFRTLSWPKKPRIKALFFLLLPLFLPLSTLGSQGLRPLSYVDPLDTLNDQHWLQPADTFNRKRFWVTAGTGALLYGATSYGLWKTWYSEFPRSSFQTINDWPEWEQMDKAGHAFTAYQYARFVMAGARWTGMRPGSSRWVAFGVSSLLQGTLEMMDAYSAQWGFSWSDIAANTAGAGFFLAQDALWKEQRILLKVSSNLRPIPDVPVLNGRGGESNLGVPVRERFGTGVVERYLKDYNNMTIWASANVHRFFPRSKVPVWLNVAIGSGVENVYGAYFNSWQDNGAGFSYNQPRYRQWFLGPDIYFSRIPTRKRWVRLLLGTLDFFKFPSPVLEYSQGKFKGRLLMW